MSAPITWVKDGVTITLQQMEDSHLRNAIKYVWRKLNPRPLHNYKYWEDRLAALGEEAQRRNWLPETLTYEELLTIAGEWNSGRSEGRARVQYTSVPLPPGGPPSRVREVAIAQRAAEPPRTIGVYIDVIGEVTAVISRGFPKRNKKRTERIERNLTLGEL